MAKWMKRFWIEIVLSAFIVACGAQAPALYTKLIQMMQILHQHGR